MLPRVLLLMMIAVLALPLTACDRGPKDARVIVRMPSKPDLERGAPVLVAGYEVGRVRSVDLAPDGRSVDVHITIRGRYRDRVFSPPETYAVVTREKGLFGSGRVVLHNGGDQPIEDGAVLQGHPSTAEALIDEAARRARAAAASAEGTARRAATALQDAASRTRERLQRGSDEQLDRMRAEAEEARVEAEAMAAELRAQVADGSLAAGEARRRVEQEAAAILSSLRRRLQEVAEEPQAQEYQKRLERLVREFDAATSAGLEASGVHFAERMGSLGAALEQEIRALNRDKAASELEAALREVHFVTGALGKVLEGVIVDAVRGPAGS